MLDSSASASTVGLCMNYASQITGQLFFMALTFTGVEASLVAIERLHGYTKLQPEPPTSMLDDPTEGSWPSQGVIEFIAVKMRYQDNLEPVLNGLTLKVQPGHKVWCLLAACCLLVAEAAGGGRLESVVVQGQVNSVMVV